MLAALRHWLKRPDLELRLSSETMASAGNSTITQSPNVINLDMEEFPDELVTKATAIVLNRLAYRVSQRLGVPDVSLPKSDMVKGIGTPEAEFESVGSD